MMELLSLLFPVAAAAAPPAPPTPPTPPAPNKSAPATSRSVFKDGEREIEIQTTGKVTFSPDSDAIYELHMRASASSTPVTTPARAASA